MSSVGKKQSMKEDDITLEALMILFLLMECLPLPVVQTLLRKFIECS